MYSRPKDYIPRRQNAHVREQKYIAVCHDWRYIHTWLAQFVNLLPRREVPESVSAPTRFSEAHAVPDIAEIMEQAEWRTGETCAGEFSSKPLPTSSQFFRRVQEIWSALDRIFEDLCATIHCTYIILRWLSIALFEFLNGQNIRNYPCRNQEFFDRYLKHSFWGERKENITILR